MVKQLSGCVLIIFLSVFFTACEKNKVIEKIVYGEETSNLEQYEKDFVAAFREGNLDPARWQLDFFMCDSFSQFNTYDIDLQTRNYTKALSISHTTMKLTHKPYIAVRPVFTDTTNNKRIVFNQKTLDRLNISFAEYQNELALLFDYDGPTDLDFGFNYDYYGRPVDGRQGFKLSDSQPSFYSITFDYANVYYYYTEAFPNAAVITSTVTPEMLAQADNPQPLPVRIKYMGLVSGYQTITLTMQHTA